MDYYNDAKRGTKMEVSPIHSQVIYQSYCLRIKEAIHTFKSMVTSLTSSVQGLYAMLMSFI
jgi:PI-3-kinase-related kinase SMG-1